MEGTGSVITNLRISHYTECKLYGGRVGAIVCFYKNGLIDVHPGDMPTAERINEWNFGPDMRIENVFCQVRYDQEHFYFECFRPDLKLTQTGGPNQ